MTNRDDGPAFPVPDLWCHSGMTLRDWFAGQSDVSEIVEALTLKECETIAGEPLPDNVIGAIKWRLKVLATFRYLVADAMIAARNPNGEQP